MTDREEIEKEIDQHLNFIELVKSQLRGISYVQNKEILDKLKEFLGLKYYRVWMWEEDAWKCPYTSIKFKTAQDLPNLNLIVPDVEEPCWFLFQLWTLSGPPIYEGTIKQIEKITRQQNDLKYEYYIIPKDFRWLIAKDHKNEMIAIGEEVENKLDRLKNI